MEILICKIIIGALTFSYVNTLEVQSGWQLLSDTAKVVLPSNLNLDHNRLSDDIKVGDTITIKIGYSNDIQTVFKGYVSGVKPSVPIEIMCQDEMWQLKQSNVSISGKSLSLGKLMKDQFSQYKTKQPDVEFGAYRFDNVSKAKVLEKIKSDFGLYSFFREETLHVGLQYDPEVAVTHKFKLDYNMIGDDLAFKRKEDIRLKVKAISNNPDGSKTEVEIGDDNGEQRSLNFYNLDKATLKATAEREMERLKYDGYRGKFIAFGKPYVKHGDIVELTSDDKSEKTGSYYVDSVATAYGLNGYRQEIELGPVISKG